MATKTKDKSNGRAGQEKIYQIVTDRIVSALEEGTVPWQRPWHVEGGVHKNLKTKTAYRGINQFLLDMTAMSAGYTAPYWLSLKQAGEMGGKVKKDSESTLVIFNKPMVWEDEKDLDENGKPKKKTYWLLRYYRVFNIEQIEGIDPKKIPAKPEHEEFTPIERGDKLLAGIRNAAKVRHGGDHASYSPLLDVINLPNPEQFTSPESYYTTRYHETIHSTGHKDRTGRIKDWAGFGSDPYAKEELVAEMGAAMLGALTGVDTAASQKNTKAYIQSWMRRFKDEPELLIKAGAQAQRACDYITGDDARYLNKED